MKQKTLAFCCVMLIAAAMLGALRLRSVAQRRTLASSNPTPVISPIDALDSCIQARFHNLTSFGMGRIPRVPQHFQPFVEFEPETSEEKASVAEFQKNNRKVGLYLCGRGILNVNKTPAQSLAKLPKVFRKNEFKQALEHSKGPDISEPVIVSGFPTGRFKRFDQMDGNDIKKRDANWVNALNAIPKSYEVREMGRKALEGSFVGKNYRGSLRDWVVEARPVRANKTACLGCHFSAGTSQRPPWPPKKSTPLRVGDALGVVVYLYRRIEGDAAGKSIL